MNRFRTLLATLLALVLGYTVPVLFREGLGPLFPTFFGAIASMGWPGQFNLDFLGFLVLSGTWLAWRHEFSPAGLALGVLGFLGGIPLLASYLLIISFRTRGDWVTLFLGPARAARIVPNHGAPAKQESP